MKKDSNNYIGHILKQYRIENKLTQEEVAEKTGIAPRYLSQLERGLSNGSIETIIKFCDFFNITPNNLLSGLLKNPNSCKLENFNINYNNLTSANKSIIDNLMLYLLKNQKK